jgi:ribosomal protein S4E|tara:strand:+ start:453 stop:683 length:231 start_codon:yes stop_codon:yes gene_type:complete
MSDDLNKKSFSGLVETYVRTHKGCAYIDAVITICDDNEIDIRDSKKLISKEIVEHIEFEAKKLNLIQGGHSVQLPI